MKENDKGRYGSSPSPSSDNNGYNCNGGNGAKGGYGGNGGNGAKGGIGGDAANGANTGNTAAASSSKTQVSGNINAHGGDANGGRGGDGGNGNGGRGGSVSVCNSLGKYGVELPPLGVIIFL